MESSGSSNSAGFVVQSDDLVPAEETGTSPRPAPLPLSQNSTSCFCRLRPCEKGRTSCRLTILLLIIIYTFLGFCSSSSFDQVTLCCLQGDEAMVLKFRTLEPVLLSVSLQSLWFINLCGSLMSCEDTEAAAGPPGWAAAAAAAADVRWRPSLGGCVISQPDQLHIHLLLSLSLSLHS